MQLIEAQQRLRKLGVPALLTSEAAAVLGVSRVVARQVMHRLSVAGVVRPLKRGLWLIDLASDPLLLAEFITTPAPAYVSLQSALFYHGIISQISQVIYVVSTARTRRYTSPVGAYSIHHLDSEFFFGYETTESGFKLATQEKALLDLLYLSPAKSGLFRRMPELDIPRSFRIKQAREMIDHVRSAQRRNLLRTRFEEVLGRR